MSSLAKYVIFLKQYLFVFLHYKFCQLKLSQAIAEIDIVLFVLINSDMLLISSNPLS